MQSLILVCLSLAACSSATLVFYGNGAVAPLDPNVHKANLEHFKAKAEAGDALPGFYFGGDPVAVSHPLVYPFYGHHLGKREADADADAYYGHLGYAGYGLGYGHLGYAGYGLGYGHAYGLPASVGGLVTYANGATVPVEPLANQVARASHLHAKFGLGHYVKKRSAQYFYGHGYGLPILPHIVPVAPFVHHPASGAVVPLESAAIVEARHAHLAEVVKQLHNGGVPEVPAVEEA